MEFCESCQIENLNEREDYSMKMVTSDFCSKCKIAKKIFDSKKINLIEIQLNSKEGKEIVEKSGLKELPILVENGNFKCGQEVINYANSLEK